jgi:hypothetical protein
LALDRGRDHYAAHHIVDGPDLHGELEKLDRHALAPALAYEKGLEGWMLEEGSSRQDVALKQVLGLYNWLRTKAPQEPAP